MGKQIEKKHWDLIVIGAGQAGLSTGYYLKMAGEDFLILEGNDRIGDNWRQRWDSLKLFTPPPYNSLPGWPNPGSGEGRTSKEEMGNYLAAYAQKFELPVHTGIRINTLSSSGSGFRIESSAGNFFCKKVVVATGTHQQPHIPDFAKDLDPGIRQLHASQYRNPETLPREDTLVIGSATSGIEIAMELSRTRYTLLAGTPSFVLPRRAFRFGPKFYWWVISNLLTIRTPFGRKVRPGILKGGAISPFLLDALIASKVTRLPRIAGVHDGLPKLADGRTLPVSVVIWCTGYKPDFSWIDFDYITDETGWPVTERGISTVIPGLYFMGVPFQFGLTSGLVGGVGRDAAFITQHITKNRSVTTIP